MSADDYLDRLNKLGGPLSKQELDEMRSWAERCWQLGGQLDFRRVSRLIAEYEYDLAKNAESDAYRSNP